LLAGWMFGEGNQIDAVLEESGGCSRLVLCGSVPYFNPKRHVKYTQCVLRNDGVFVPEALIFLQIFGPPRWDYRACGYRRFSAQ
jgi:hypothetical protein